MTSHYLSHWWPNLPTHICETWPRWVQISFLSYMISHRYWAQDKWLIKDNYRHGYWHMKYVLLSQINREISHQVSFYVSGNQRQTAIIIWNTCCAVVIAGTGCCRFGSHQRPKGPRFHPDNYHKLAARTYAELYLWYICFVKFVSLKWKTMSCTLNGLALKSKYNCAVIASAGWLHMYIDTSFF